MLLLSRRDKHSHSSRVSLSVQNRPDQMYYSNTFKKKRCVYVLDLDNVIWSSQLLKGLFDG